MSPLLHGASELFRLSAAANEQPANSRAGQVLHVVR
jgi:hypothetical protein